MVRMKIQIKTIRFHLLPVNDFLPIILVMPFSIADCERSFSAMNIKTDSRNKLGDILNELMLLYDMTPTKRKRLN
eukprot:UN24309